MVYLRNLRISLCDQFRFASVNQPMILVGGTLIFIAAVLILIQLWNVRGGTAPPA